MRALQSEEHGEIERKYDVDATCAVPDLLGVAGVSEVTPAVEFDQVATYFDTSDLRLLSAGVTLRRRSGGVDDGWQLKLPADGDKRQEVRTRLADPDDHVPQELLERVRAIVRNQPVAQSAVLSTHRVVQQLLDSRGLVLAELCDDQVSAVTMSGAPTVEEWREWEVELAEGHEDLLDEVEPILIEAGARRATVVSKLSRVLDERLPVSPPWPKGGGLGGNPSTADLLCSYLGKQLVRLEEQDRLLRSGDQEGVHQLRVAARRLRSALATYAPILQPGATNHLRGELKWLGGVLAEARDAQVLGERLNALVAEEPADLVLGRVLARIDDELRAKLRAGRVAADAALNSERYFRLLDDLEAFLEEPPLVEAAGPPARKMAPELLRADLKRVRRRQRAYEGASSATQRDLDLHEVRKAAKRLRYAAETVGPMFGKRAKRLAARAEAVQEHLGEHQDTLVARRMLREIAVRAHLDGENGFTFGRLHALEQARAEDLERTYPRVFARLPRRDLRAWLEG